MGRPQSEAVPLAFVQFYTTDLTGAMDNTRLTKICWEMESRPAADLFPDMAAEVRSDVGGIYDQA